MFGWRKDYRGRLHFSWADCKADVLEYCLLTVFALGTVGVVLWAVRGFPW